MRLRSFHLFIILILVIPVIVTGGSKRKASVDDVHGEWFTIDYSEALPSPPAKVICSIDGTLSEYSNLSSNEPQDRGTFSIIESWVDEQGNLYLKVNCAYEKPDSIHNTFDLWKLDSSGTVWELNRSLTDFPSKIDRTDPSYMLFNRR